MARLEADFQGDLSDLDGGTFTVVPPGKYEAIITSADIEPVKDRETDRAKGLKIAVVAQIISGQYKGVTIRDTINIRNENPDAERIGKERKARIGVILCGTPNPADTDMFKNKPLIIETITEPYNGKVYNKIKQYHPINGEFKDLIAGKKTQATASHVPPANAPAHHLAGFAHSAVTDGRGNIYNPLPNNQTGAQLTNDEIPEIPF